MLVRIVGVVNVGAAGSVDVVKDVFGAVPEAGRKGPSVMMIRAEEHAS